MIIDYLSTYVDEQLRRLRVQAVTVQALRQLDARLTARGLAVSTLSKAVGLVRAALRLAVEEGLILISPGDLVRVRATAADRQRVDTKRALPPAELRRLLEVADSHWLEVMVVILFSLGTRRGEALGIAWADVDWAAGTIFIHQQVRMVGKAHELGPLKNPHSIRTMHMHPSLRAALEAQRAKQAAWRAACGELWIDSGLVITDEVGRMVSPQVPNRVLGRFAREADIKRLSSHSGRYTNITGQIRAGVPIEVERHARDTRTAQ